MTHDELIAAGIWSGAILEIRQRMAEYIVDGVRFGTVELETKSGSPNDIYLEKGISEVTTAAMVLSRLGMENVELFSLDVSGKPLESPDLDAVLPDGRKIGIEVADVIATEDAKHGASRSGVEVVVADLIDNDPSFATAFGQFYFSTTLNGVGPHTPVKIGSKREMQSIADEVVRYIRCREHQSTDDEYFRDFPAAYETLRARGAQFHAERMDAGPYFSLSEGASAIGRVNHSAEVLRVLDKHRRQAAKYRPGPTWMILFLTDSFEYFNNTIAAIATTKPPISPFERVYLMDSASRIEALT